MASWQGSGRRQYVEWCWMKWEERRANCKDLCLRSLGNYCHGIWENELIWSDGQWVSDVWSAITVLKLRSLHHFLKISSKHQSLFLLVQFLGAQRRDWFSSCSLMYFLDNRPQSQFSIPLKSKPGRMTIPALNLSLLHADSFISLACFNENLSRSVSCVMYDFGT